VFEIIRVVGFEIRLCFGRVAVYFSSIQFKKFNHPTRSNFVVVVAMAGS